MAQFVLLVLAAMVGWGLWRICRPRPLFEIRLTNGIARRTRGNVSASFVNDVRETCRALGVTQGAIRGTARGNRIGLEFSGPISPVCRQRLRNLWSSSKDSERRPG
jgi:hypothetical protein